MKDITNNIRLRERISEITKDSIPTKHGKLIEKIKNEFKHNIILISNPNFIDTTEDCFLFVMEKILKKDEIKKLGDIDTNNIENIDRLINKGFLLLHDEYKENDKIVIYLHENKIMHFGWIENESVVSKWGKGLIWEHQLFEVPITYGSTVKYSDGFVNLYALNI